MSDGGKGSKQRPTNHKQYSNSWDTIFRKNSLGTQGVNAEAATQKPCTLTAAAIVSNASRTGEEKVMKMFAERGQN